jgi:hypothetical protein
MIDSLIDKTDSFEQVRDQIAAILAYETVSQQALAVTAGKDPKLWKLRVFLERSNAFEQFLNSPIADVSPIVNVWFDNSTYDMKSSNYLERQTSETIYNIDCYGYGEAKDDGSTGHIPGDLTAALELQRAIRLVRNILMAANYAYLALDGLVGSRWINSIIAFQPDIAAVSERKVHAARIAFKVGFNEFSPQITPETLEYISADVKRTADGEIVAEADYNFNP